MDGVSRCASIPDSPHEDHSLMPAKKPTRAASISARRADGGRPCTLRRTAAQSPARSMGTKDTAPIRSTTHEGRRKGASVGCCRSRSSCQCRRRSWRGTKSSTRDRVRTHARHAAHLPERPTQAVVHSARDTDLWLPTGDAGEDEVVELAHGADLLRLIVGDSDAERLLDGQHHGYRVGPCQVLAHGSFLHSFSNEFTIGVFQTAPTPAAPPPRAPASAHPPRSSAENGCHAC